MSLSVEDPRKGRSRSHSRSGSKDRRSVDHPIPGPPVPHADTRESSYVYPEDDLEDRYGRHGAPQASGALPYPEEAALPGDPSIYRYDSQAPIHQPASPSSESHRKPHGNGDDKLPGAFPVDAYRVEDSPPRTRRPEPRDDKSSAAQDVDDRFKFLPQKYSRKLTHEDGGRSTDQRQEGNGSVNRHSWKDFQETGHKKSGSIDKNPYEWTGTGKDSDGSNPYGWKGKERESDEEPHRSWKDRSREDDLAYGKPAVPKRPPPPTGNLAYGGSKDANASNQDLSQALMPYRSYSSDDDSAGSPPRLPPRQDHPDYRDYHDRRDHKDYRDHQDRHGRESSDSDERRYSAGYPSGERATRRPRGDSYLGGDLPANVVPVEPESRDRGRDKDSSRHHRRDKSSSRAGGLLVPDEKKRSKSKSRERSRDRRKDKSPSRDTLTVDSGRHRDRSRSKDRSKDKDKDKHSKSRSKSRSRSPMPPSSSMLDPSRLGAISLGGGLLAGGLAAGGASPLLESYHGTYQDCSPMPSPLLLAAQHPSEALLPLEPLSPGGSDLDSDGKKRGRRARFHDSEDITTQLATALKGHRHPDVEPLIEILPSLTHEQVMDLRVDYKKLVKTGSDKKGVNIAKHIRSRLRDEDPLLMKACYAVALGRWESESYWANFWYQGDKTRREMLIESLMGRTNAEIWQIKDAFSDKKYGHSLTKCMKAELKEDKFKKAVLMVLDMQRMEEYDEYGQILPISHELVDQDVDDLRKAVRSDKGGETAMINIVVQRSDAHLRAVLQEYSRLYEANFARDALRKSGNLVGELLAHILNGVINRPVRDALLVHHAVTASRKDNLRRELLISRLVRFHWDADHMRAVKMAYRERYGVSLQEAVRDATKGDWGRFCSELCIARMPNDVRRFDSIHYSAA